MPPKKKKSDFPKNLVEKQRIVRELENCLPFLKNLHDYCKDKLNYNPKLLDDPNCVLDEDEFIEAVRKL